MEFVAFLLRGLEIRGLDMRWAVHLQIGTLTFTHDQNENDGACTAAVLQFDPAQMDDHHVELQNLILDWSNQHGRLVALTHPSPLLCFQIDRYVSAGDGTIYKSDMAVQFHDQCGIPFFTGDDLQMIWKEYQVVSMIARLGQDQAGHCRSLLVMAPNPAIQDKIQALLTEDWIATTCVQGAVLDQLQCHMCHAVQL